MEPLRGHICNLYREILQAGLVDHGRIQYHYLVHTEKYLHRLLTLEHEKQIKNCSAHEQAVISFCVII